MPRATVFSLGVNTGISVFRTLPLPSIEGQAVRINRVSVVRSGGLHLTTPNNHLVGLTHQTDILDGNLLDDEDDILTDTGFDIWWYAGLSLDDHKTEALVPPKLVAGPQGMIFFNGGGAITAVRLDVDFDLIPLRNLTRWALLKKLTSYEGTP